MPEQLLNLGCGHVTPDGWINVDGSNRAWLASKFPWIDRALVSMKLIPTSEFSRVTTFADLRKRFLWPDASIDGIYMGELLEHFTKEQGENIIDKCFRVLKPNGILRIRVPDHANFWRNYVSQYAATKEKPREQWNDEHTRWTKMHFGDICVRKPGRLASFGHFHKWMYDDISLILLLESVGFQSVERMAFHDSRLARIEDIEVRDDLIVEAVKPQLSDVDEFAL